MKLDPIIILNEKELRENVHLDHSLIDEIEKGFIALSNKEATVPPIMMLPVPKKDGEVDIKSAFVHTMGSMAVKIASGFFKNPDIGLAFTKRSDARDFDRDRDASGCIARQRLSYTDKNCGSRGDCRKIYGKKEVSAVGVFGCGVQSRYQMEALSLVRRFDKIVMFSIDTSERKKAFVDEMKERLNVEVVIAESGEQLVRECDIVVTTTPSRKAYFSPKWLHPGLHITSMGSDAEDKQELYADVFEKVDVIACDLITQSTRLGELRAPKEAGYLNDLSSVRENRRYHLRKEEGQKRMMSR